MMRLCIDRGMDRSVLKPIIEGLAHTSTTSEHMSKDARQQIRLVGVESFRT